MVESTAEGTGNEVAHRVLIVDDRPEIRLLVRTRLRMLDDIEVVGEASNGEEALVLVSSLAPEAVVFDLEMPVMSGDEAIPKMRELAPGIRILLYSGADKETLERISEGAQPDAFVRKDRPLTELVEQLQVLLDMGPYDILRLSLGAISLLQAMTAFDTWVGLNLRILEAMARGDDLVSDQLSGATLGELQTLIGVYAHLGDSLQKAARQKVDDIVLIVHAHRTTAAAARRALVAFNHHRLKEFYAAWQYEVPESAAGALDEMRDRLMEALPTSSADETESDEPTVDNDTSESDEAVVEGATTSVAAKERAAAAIDREAAAIDRAAATETRAVASTDELTGTYLRGPGHVELQREIVRARRTNEPLTLAFLDVDGLKRVNDSLGHAAGDQLLRDVAAVLRDQLRDYDVIVRHGGDEFLCAMPGMSMAQATKRMELLHTSLAADPNHWSVSVGLAVLEDDDSLETLIKRADEALYAKRSHKPRAR